MSAEGQVEHQKLNQMTALLLFCWVFGIQLDLLEKIDSPKALNRDGPLYAYKYEKHLSPKCRIEVYTFLRVGHDTFF